MAQEEQYIAIISERLSKPGDTRYIIIDRQTREIKDDGMGRGYKSAQAAHKSFAYKQRERQRREKARQMKAEYRQASQPAAAVRSSQPAVTVDPQTGVTRVNTWSGFPPRRNAHRQWTSQENTPPPPPESYDAK